MLRGQRPRPDGGYEYLVCIRCGTSIHEPVGWQQMGSFKVLAAAPGFVPGAYSDVLRARWYAGWVRAKNVYEAGELFARDRALPPLTVMVIQHEPFLSGARPAACIYWVETDHEIELPGDSRQSLNW